jgi:hypothetical protein
MGWFVALSAASWFAVVAISGGAFVVETTAGMLGPLAATMTSWAVVARTHRTAPTRVMHVLLQGFIAKLLFFCLYVIVMLRFVSLQPTPFALSFTGHFVGLYATQAVFLRRLLRPAAPASA